MHEKVIEYNVDLNIEALEEDKYDETEIKSINNLDIDIIVDVVLNHNQYDQQYPILHPNQ